MATHNESSGQSNVITCQGWQAIANVLSKHYRSPDVEAARVLCAALASHALKQFPTAWCLAIAPPGSMKTKGIKKVCATNEARYVCGRNIDLKTAATLADEIDEVC